MTPFSPGESNAFSETSQFEDKISHDISTAALVRLLIRKRILTPAELLQEERLFRLENNLQGKRNLHKKLKSWAAKHRWSRRLTHILLGWKWRRSRHESRSDFFPEG